MSDQNTLLKVEGITKRFGGLVAVNQVDMEINKGEIIGLIGPNGAGKTTLFNVIAGMFPPNEGKVIFDGVDITKMRVDKICHRGIGRTFQIVQPFENLTVLENVMVGSFVHTSDVETAKKEAEEVLELVGMSELKNAVGRGMSLQHLKRMEVARALATKPKLLLLDEVMAGLSPSASQEFIKTILKIRDTGITILVIEHVIKAIMTLSDRIYVLNQGNLVAHGDPVETINNPEVVKSYLGEKRHA